MQPLISHHRHRLWNMGTWERWRGTRASPCLGDAWARRDSPLSLPLNCCTLCSVVSSPARHFTAFRNGREAPTRSSALLPWYRLPPFYCVQVGADSSPPKSWNWSPRVGVGLNFVKFGLLIGEFLNWGGAQFARCRLNTASSALSSRSASRGSLKTRRICIRNLCKVQFFGLMGFGLLCSLFLRLKYVFTYVGCFLSKSLSAHILVHLAGWTRGLSSSTLKIGGFFWLLLV